MRLHWRHGAVVFRDRFHDAQAGGCAGYASALAEIRAGRKSGHWIWYIFPQLDGLGHSTTARIYAIRDVNEACGYLLDPVLRARYEEITAAVAEQLARGVSIGNLIGGSTDALKLVSSLTLFRLAASRIVKGECESVFALLEQLCEIRPAANRRAGLWAMPVHDRSLHSLTAALVRIASESLIRLRQFSLPGYRGLARRAPPPVLHFSRNGDGRILQSAHVR